MQMEKAMAPHSSTLAWKIPWMEGAWWAAVHGVARSRTRLSDFTFTFHVHALEKDMATHSSVLAWRIPGTGSLVGCCLWGRTDPACHMEQPKKKQQKTWPLLRTFKDSVYMCSVVSNSATPWTVACQAPLSMGILQARILEWVVMPSSTGSSRPRD